MIFYFILFFVCEEKYRFVGLHRNSNSRPNVGRFRGYQLHHRGDQTCTSTYRWLFLEIFLGRPGLAFPLNRLRFSYRLVIAKKFMTVQKETKLGLHDLAPRYKNRKKNVIYVPISLTVAQLDIEVSHID